MNISTKCTYGTRALLDLAIHQDEGLIFLKDIAKRQQISLNYLQRIVMPLAGAQIIRTVRGSKGGVSLAKPPEQVKLSDVFKLLEGSISVIGCTESPSVCARSSSCVTREFWAEFTSTMYKFLDSKTLKDLVEMHKKLGLMAASMYYI